MTAISSLATDGETYLESHSKIHYGVVLVAECCAARHVKLAFGNLKHHGHPCLLLQYSKHAPPN